VSNTFNRRSFLRRSGLTVAGLAAVGGASGLLAACGSDDDSSSSGSTSGSGSKDFGTLDYQLSWIKNVEFAGQYIADTNGYYDSLGFTGVNLKAGGPNVQQDSVIASKKAFIGISAPDITGSAILKGADIIAVGALFQKNPFAIMSLADNPIPDPEAMKGKKIGVQAVNEPVWNAFLKAAKIDPGDVTKVPAQFDPQPLVAGEVDGWFSFFTNEPNLLKMQGIETEVFLLNDHDYPLVSQISIVHKSTLDSDREKLKAAMIGDIKGWRGSLKDPTKGAELAANKYGKTNNLDVEEQTLESKDQNKLILTDETKANGIYTVSDTVLEETIATLEIAGIKLTADKLFDLSIIDEIYKENPDLKAAI
jgi:ABC-type nitrate/sulfonate/bicarbonate transport system substrate-binding protein